MFRIKTPPNSHLTHKTLWLTIYNGWRCTSYPWPLETGDIQLLQGALQVGHGDGG